MPKIGFINPPSEFLIDQRVFLSLGVLRVATSLQKKYDVRFLDLSNETFYNDRIKEYIEKNDLDVICITATTPQIQRVYEFCQYIKNNFDVKIVLGGPHVTLMHSSLGKGSDDVWKICKVHFDELEGCVDTIVIGDGEYAIYDAIESDKKLINSEENAALYIQSDNYDDIAIPNRNFLDLSSYRYVIDDKKSTNLISQMGCPYRCLFCSGRSSSSYNRIRKRSIGNIISEIDILYKVYGYEGFMFYDDELNLNKSDFNELLLKLIDYQDSNGVDFNLRGFTRSNLLDAHQAGLMYKAGFKWLLVGFESGSDRILQNMNKGCTVEDNTKCFDIARDNGLKVKALMSIGHPGESASTIKESLGWLRMVKPEETDISIISVYPGSEYFNKSTLINNEVLRYTANGTNDSLYIKNIDFLKESNFYKSSEDGYVSFVHTDHLDREAIVEQRSIMEKEIKK